MMKPIRLILYPLSVFVLGCSTLSQQPASELALTGIRTDYSAEEYTELCDNTLQQLQQDFTEFENDTATATVESVFGGFDDMLMAASPLDQNGLIRSTHPDKDLRNAASDCSVKFSEFWSRVSLSQDMYRRVTEIDVSALPEIERYMVEEEIKGFQQSGVNLDEPSRKKVAELRKQIREAGNEFSKNIREDVRYVETTVDGLAGLPEDYISSHQPDENGVVKLSTQYTDYQPVMLYAEDEDLRHRLRVANRSRAYPENEAVLKRVLTLRFELARLLGYDDWASLSMSNNMVETPETAQNYLQQVSSAIQVPLKQELKVQLDELNRLQPGHEQVEVWQSFYLDELIRKQRYALDAKQLREYFSFARVKQGIFDLTEQLFDVQITPWETAVWHDSVEAYQVYDQGKLLGGFYLDSHPREGKYQHAAHFTIRTGVEGRRLPLSALVQNLPTGLMEHDQVETFLHEFGHLLHNLFSGGQRWSAIAGMSMERDFVEAPSQMLEEWVWDYETLKTFAMNDKGEVIPKELVEKMNRARDYGLAIRTAVQLYYANLSLNFYRGNPENLDLMQLTRQLSKQYNPFPFVEGTAFYCNFGHLYGYSSNYYTYQWSLGIASDLFSEFEKHGLRDRETAQRYRKTVLAAAGSKPSAEMVEDFLGRPYNPKAYLEKLSSLEN